MEKADKAIALAADNAARIESTARLLRSHISGGVSVMKGKFDSGITQFGAVRAGSGVIVGFSGDPVSLKLNGNTIVDGASPLIAAIEYDGELELNDWRENAVAMVIHNQ